MKRFDPMMLALRIAFIPVFILGLVRCAAPRTETPVEVTVEQASYNGNDQNSGIVDIIANGVIISPEKHDDYLMEIAWHGDDPFFKGQFAISNGMTLLPSGNFLVDDQHFVWFEMMLGWDRKNDPHHLRQISVLKKIGL